MSFLDDELAQVREERERRDRGEETSASWHGDRFRARLYIGPAVCQLPAPVPLVDGLLFVPGESSVFAPPKVGKTFFALDLALSVVTGRPFMGRHVTRGAALYVAAEGVGGIGGRVDAWCAHHDRYDIDDAAFLATAVNLTDRGAVGALCELVAERQATLTILDTLARCSVGADENSARDMGRIVEALDQIRDATTGHVQVIHHAGKDATKGMRGSNALLGALDTVVELTASADQIIRVQVTEQKDAERLDDWYCRLEPSNSSVVIVPVSDLDVFTGAQHRVLEALMLLPAEDRTSTKWEEMAKDLGVSRTVFFEAKKALGVRGHVTGGGGRGRLYHITDEPSTEGTDQ